MADPHPSGRPNCLAFALRDGHRSFGIACQLAIGTAVAWLCVASDLAKKPKKGKARSGQQANGLVALRLRSVTTHPTLGYSCSCQATFDVWRSEAPSVRPNRFRTTDLQQPPPSASHDHPTLTNRIHIRQLWAQYTDAILLNDNRRADNLRTEISRAEREELQVEC